MYHEISLLKYIVQWMILYSQNSTTLTTNSETGNGVVSLPLIPVKHAAFLQRPPEEASGS